MSFDDEIRELYILLETQPRKNGLYHASLNGYVEYTTNGSFRQK
jgi:hypothetical protein